MESEQRELLTIDEMADRLKVKRSWLYSRTRKMGEGSMPRVRIGKFLRFRESEVLAWIRNKYGEIQS